MVRSACAAQGEPAEDETGYDDEYNLEELEIVAADFVKKVAVVDFKEAWSTIGGDCEVVETFSLSYAAAPKSHAHSPRHTDTPPPLPPNCTGTRRCSRRWTR